MAEMATSEPNDPHAGGPLLLRRLCAVPHNPGAGAPTGASSQEGMVHRHLLVVIAVLLVALAACGGEAAETDTPAETEPGGSEAAAGSEASVPTSS